MKGSVLKPSTKGFLLFVLLHLTLILYASAQTNTTASPTTMASNTTSVTNQTTNSTSAPSLTTLATGTNGTNGTNGTAMLSCQVLTCNYSACSSAFSSTNATTCSASESFCELRREADASYSSKCTSTCLSACTNTSQNNCSVNCCSSNCVSANLNSLLNSSLIMTTTTAATTTTTARSSTVVTSTMATNGKKCHKFSCTGDSCYQSNTNVVLCSPGQNYCMLKKTSTTVITWTGSCIEDCTKEMVCTSSNTNCALECCNATTTSSCLKLNGQVNFVGSGTIAPCSYMPLVVSSLFLWLVMMGKSTD